MPDYIPSGSIAIVQREGELRVDSRLIAGRLGLHHGEWVTNIIKKYQTQVEKHFGILTPIGTENTGRGRPETAYWLNEDQACCYMTMSRNNANVIEAKVELVKKFSQAKQALRQTLEKSVALAPVDLESELVTKLKAKASKASTLDDLKAISDLAEKFTDLLDQIG